MLKRINTYLIENHPNVWHLRLPYLILTGLVLHIIAFLFGYIYLNERVLAETSYYQFSMESNFVLVQVILLLIVFFLWGLQFYKNSVLKNYYIAGRFYGVKLFALIALLFFWNLSSFITFDLGLNIKKVGLVQKHNYKNLAKEKNFMNPLLLLSGDEYDLDKNSYLTSNNIQFDDTDANGFKGIRYCTKENYLKYTKRNKYFTQDCLTGKAEIDSNFYSQVENSTIIFYQLENIEPKKGCQVNVIGKFLKLDDYHWNELQNHPDYSKELDQYIKEKNYDELVKRMTAFKQKLNAIYQYTNFNPQINLDYILQKKGLNLSSIISEYERDDMNASIVLDKSDVNYLSEEFEELSRQNYYFSQYKWETTMNSLERTPSYYSTFLITFIVSVVLAYFLVQFQIINFINFAITVPIAGVMLVVGILIYALIWSSMREYSFSIYLVVLLGSLITVYRMNQRLKERANEIFILLFATLIPITVMVVYGVIGSKIYIEKVFNDPCTDTFSSYEYFNAPSFYELHFLALGILSCIGFLLLVKKLKSKPE